MREDRTLMIGQALNSRPARIRAQVGDADRVVLLHQIASVGIALQIFTI